MPRRSAFKTSPLAAITDAANGFGARALPRIPDKVKRQLIGRRAIAIDGNTLDPSLQMMLAAWKVMGVHGLTDGNAPTLVRKNTLRTLSQLNYNPIAVKETSDLTIPGPGGDIAVRHYRPEDAGRGPLMVFYHGGGWVFGDLNTHDRLCRLICRDAGIHVLSVDYRLAPEHPAPAALTDAFAAYQWAVTHASELGADPDSVCVGGDSAGGNLAAVVAHQARDVGSPLALQLLLCANVDMRGDTRSRKLFADGFFLTRKDIDLLVRYYLTNSEMRITDAKVSPLLSTNFAGLAPAIVVTAGFDPLRDEGESYAAALEAAGNVVDLRRFGSMTHPFALMDALGGGCAAAVSEITAALKAHLHHRRCPAA